MSLVKLTIKGISYSQTQNGAYALILNEVDGERKLPIVIGAFEAQSIAIALEKTVPCKRIGMTVIGLEVPHAHVHLIPLNMMDDARFHNKVKLTPEEFQELANVIANNL